MANIFENYTTLIPASEAKKISETSAKTKDKEALIFQINYAANVGQNCIWYNRDIPEEVIAELEDSGYKVIKSCLAPIQYFISW